MSRFDQLINVLLEFSPSLTELLMQLWLLQLWQNEVTLSTYSDTR